MRKIGLAVLLGVLFGAAGLTAVAQDVSKLDEAAKKQYNAWMAERAEKMVSAHRLEKELDEAWGDFKYTTPEIDALRTRFRELQQELARTQRALQEKVEAVPAVREKRKQLDEAKGRIQELASKINDLTAEKR